VTDPTVPAIPLGLEGRARLTVDEEDTASAFGSGDVPVLATPRVIALCEEATVAAIEGWLRPGQTSVGARVEIDHVRPTAIGKDVIAAAVLDEVAYPRLRFAVVAIVDGEEVAAGRVTRVVVRRDHFMARV